MYSDQSTLWYCGERGWFKVKPFPRDVTKACFPFSLFMMRREDEEHASDREAKTGRSGKDSIDLPPSGRMISSTWPLDLPFWPLGIALTWGRLRDDFPVLPQSAGHFQVS